MPSSSAKNLKAVLDSYEQAIHQELVESRLRRAPWRSKQLAMALDHLALARAELARYPQRAQLALYVCAVVRLRYGGAIALANVHRHAAAKGLAVASMRRRRRPAHHTRILAAAKKLDPHLSRMAKARIIHQRHPELRLSVRHIRRILTPPKK